MNHNPLVSRQTVTQHPSPVELLAFGQGLCDDRQEREIGRHILQCDACCQALMEVPDDPLLDRLRGGADPNDTSTGANRGVPDTDVDALSADRPPRSEQIDQLLRDHPKYELIRRLGEGGMGVVYQVRHRIMGRVVALKVISPKITSHPEAESRFRREVQIVAKLNHPNIVAAFDADQIGEHPCLVSEYFESRSLDQLAAAGPIEVTRACDLVRQAALGLAHAHDNGLIHRDVKPQNILVSPSGQVKVVDFGLANYTEPDHPDHQRLTSVGIIVGTPDYLSPEQIRESTVDCRADIYSLGCTLYFLLSRSPPFPDGSRVEKLAHHLQTQPKPLASIRTDIPVALDECVAKMMAKDPGQRFQSAAELVAALETCTSTPASIVAVPSVTAVPPPRIKATRASTARASKQNRSHSARGKRVLVGVISVILLGMVGWAAMRGLERFGAEPQAVESLEIPAAWKNRTWRILAVVPPEPLPRDQNLLYHALHRLGLKGDITSTSSASSVQGIHKLIPLRDAEPTQYDAVVFFGPAVNTETALSQSPARAEVERILDSARRNGQPVASLGSGLWTLGRLGVLRGKRAADCVHSSAEFKRETGADWVNGSTLVTDGRLITGTNTTDARRFIIRLLEMITDQSGRIPSSV